MRKGKLIAQGSHAVVGAILQLFFGNRLTEDSFEGSGNEEKSWKINKELQNTRPIKYYTTSKPLLYFYYL